MASHQIQGVVVHPIIMRSLAAVFILKNTSAAVQTENRFVALLFLDVLL
jgi:hypothetical protein